MLVSRPFDSGRNTWSTRKFEDIFHNASSPRMSTFEGLSAQSDWRDQYSAFPLSSDNGLLSSTYEHTDSSNLNQGISTRTQTSSRPPLGGHRHTTGPLLQEQQEPIPKIERPDSAPGDCGAQETEEKENETLGVTESAASLLDGDENGEALVEVKDEDDDEEIDDDEMLDAEEGGPPQTAAERRAERRKMKRFRLTHQQTRFLMSEFAKQAHPDASHRERLSKEIPGLSPRQVQVWFQNRRAKIKRLTADDRDRMMKMRAVPDDFDSVQALHSPYGAVHGINTPLQSPVDFMPSYAEHMMRPLMIDTMRRHEGDDQQHMSPTGLSPAFGHVGFNAGASVTSGDVLSPLSINSSDRFYGSQLSSPLSAGPRSGHFDRSSIYQGLPHSRQHVRPLQPLQLRETMSRNRAESLQSPLRSSMSWKGETLDYGNFQTGHTSPQLSGRAQSLYQPEHVSNNAVTTTGFDSSSFTATSSHSPPHIGFAATLGPSQSLQQSAPSAMSRLRSSSGSAFPAGLDLRNQFRAMSSQANTNHLSSPRSGSFSNAFTGGYPSAPLTAPVDFTLSRGNPDTSRDFNMPQMSAPMQASNDFANAYTSSMNNGSRDQNQSDHREYNEQAQQMEESTQHLQQQEEQLQAQHQHSRTSGENSFLRTSNFDTPHKRKRSFTMPGNFETA